MSVHVSLSRSDYLLDNIGREDLEQEVILGPFEFVQITYRWARLGEDEYRLRMDTETGEWWMVGAAVDDDHAHPWSDITILPSNMMEPA